MTVLLQYRKADGYILGVWQAATDTLLQSQVADAEVLTGYQLLETDVPLPSIVEDYYLHASALVAKEVLVLAATPAPFAADGASECVVTVAPFISCTLLVNGEAFALSETDLALVLTADSPQTFAISLEPMGPYKADPLTVEAI